MCVCLSVSFIEFDLEKYAIDMGRAEQEMYSTPK